MKEIGSEFCIDNKLTYQPDADAYYCLSGRTALDLIVKDIISKGKPSGVYMPSYCCDSMLEPFIRNGVSIKYYDVTEDGTEYDYHHGCGAVLLIDYFGYEDRKNAEIAKKEKENGHVVIYDETHKLNGNDSVDADYRFCSYRKWFFSNSAVVKSKTPLTVFDKASPNNEYCSLRNAAALKKAAYLCGENVEKSEFLQEFQKAEAILEGDYSGYGAELSASLSRVAIDKIAMLRRTNATYLIDELKGFDNLKLFRPLVGTADSPLFVPIMVSEKYRDALRRYLIARGVFCPVHWPKSRYFTDKARFFAVELSLICDQRYGMEEMKYQTNCIKEFFAKC